MFNLQVFAQQNVDDLVPLSIVVLSVAFTIFQIASLCKVFAKAGKPWWGAIVPIYNVVLMLEIAGRPIWWVFLFIIPLVNIIVAVIVAIDVAKQFGRGTGFGLGLAFLGLIFYPILGFGSAEYQPASRD